MEQTLTKALLAFENATYRGTNGTSENNRCLGFRPAFIDRETCAVYLSRYPDGRLAPCHLLDGLPSELVLARSRLGRVTRVKASVVSGFVHDDSFYSRVEAAAFLVSTPEADLTRSADVALRRAAQPNPCSPLIDKETQCIGRRHKYWHTKASQSEPHLEIMPLP